MSGFNPLTLAIILMILGCGLVVLEVFIPSGGLLSFLSAIVILASLITAFQRDTTTGLTFIIITLLAVPTAVALAFKYWPHTPMGRAFLGELPAEDELTPADPRRELVGRLGVAKTKMLPSGSVQIDGCIIDAVSQGAAIDLGQPVIVVEVRANRVIVRVADENEAREGNRDPHDLFSKPLDELGLGSIEEPLG